MAHLQKYKSVATHAILDHCARSRSGTLDRENIDRSRTPQNLTLGASDPAAGKAAILDRIKSVKESHTKITKKKVRSDAVEFGDWIITAPQSLPDHLHQEFFKKTFEFLQQRYGAENVPCGFVHMDESQPHMHCPVVPEKDGKLTAFAVFNRKDLQSFHSDLQKKLEKELGCRVEIILDDDKVLEKAFSALPSKELQKLDNFMDELQALEAEKGRLKNEIGEMQKDLQSLEVKKSNLVTQTDRLIAEKTHLEAETRKIKERTEALNAEKSLLTAQIETLRSEVDNPLATIILEAKEATEAVFRLYGEYEELEHSAWTVQYGDFSDMRAEPLEPWNDHMCEVQIVKRPFKEPVVQMSLKQWEQLKDAHNRLISAYKDAITTLKSKVEKLIDFLKKMPEHVPQYFKLEELHKKLARYDLMDRERYVKAAKAGKEETYELTRKAANGQRVQRPTFEERMKQAKAKLAEEQARQTKTKRKSRDDDLVR